MDSHGKVNCAQRTEAIRRLNDRLRRTGQGGKVMMTSAVADLPPAELIQLLSQMRQFENFTAENDPYGEHDFGSVVIDGQSYFWKIDAYDVNFEFGSPDASDETVTCRVLTLMHASDW